MDVSIDQADETSVDSVALLFDEYRQFYGQASDIASARQFLQARLNAGESTILLALAGDVAVGFAQLYPSFSSVSMRPIWVLNDLFVDVDSRRLGVATRLLEAAAEFGRSTSAIRLVLATATDNQAAQSLYEKHGWQQDREFLHYALPLS